MEDKLTEAQIERQDVVDGAIWGLIRALCPREIKIPWDIEEISEVREVIQEILSEHGIPEMEFYPYLELRG